MEVIIMYTTAIFTENFRDPGQVKESTNTAESLEKIIKTLMIENKNLKNRQSSLNDSLEIERSYIETINKEDGEELDELNKELDTLNEEMNKSNEYNKGLLSHLEYLEKDISILDGNYKILKTKNRKLKKENRKLEKKKIPKYAENTIKNLEESNKLLRKTIREMNKEKREHSKTVTNTLSKINSMTDNILSRDEKRQLTNGRDIAGQTRIIKDIVGFLALKISLQKSN